MLTAGDEPARLRDDPPAFGSGGEDRPRDGAERRGDALSTPPTVSGSCATRAASKTAANSSSARTGRPATRTSATSRGRAERSGARSATRSAGAPVSRDGAGSPSLRAATVETAAESRASDTRPVARAAASSSRSVPAPLTSASVPSSTSRPAPKSAREAVAPYRNALDVGHHTAAHPARARRARPSASVATRWTAASDRPRSPRASASAISSRAPRLVPSARCIAQGPEGATPGASRTDCAVGRRGTRSGKSRSKSSSHASWWTAVVAPPRIFFSAPKRRASRRGSAWRRSNPP